MDKRRSIQPVFTVLWKSIRLFKINQKTRKEGLKPNLFLGDHHLPRFVADGNRLAQTLNHSTQITDD